MQVKKGGTSMNFWEDIFQQGGCHHREGPVQLTFWDSSICSCSKHFKQIFRLLYWLLFKELKLTFCKLSVPLVKVFPSFER